jgi:hypothetical protein
MKLKNSMKGLIQVTATKGGRTITSEVFGDMGDKEDFIRSANEPSQNSTQRTPLMEVK